MLSQAEGWLRQEGVGCAGSAGRQPSAGTSQPVAAWTLCDLPHRPTLMIGKHHTQDLGFGGLSSPVRYAKFLSIRYFIDIDIFQNRYR